MSGTFELEPGDRLGTYEIQELLGPGRTGPVYRAHDLKLERAVAIEMLPPSVGENTTALEGIETEAKALARLHHPNIAAIYRIEVDGPRHFLVLEYIEGDYLSELLGRGPLPLRLAVSYALQLSDALAQAHAHGVEHRRLHPGTVKLDTEQGLKVLNLGLGGRKRTDSGGAGLSKSLENGFYSSPEQIHHREPIDRRTDIWSFGCMMFEMLSGYRPFERPSSEEAAQAILSEEPPWKLLPDDTPPVLIRILRRCLQKETRQRLQDMGDARTEIEEWLAVPEARAASRKRFQWAYGMAALAALGLGLLSLVIWRPKSSEPSSLPIRARLHAPAGTHFPFGTTPTFDLSTDGQLLAFVAVADDDDSPDEESGSLYVRDLSTLEAVRLPGTEGARQPFLSPDGESIGFFADRKLLTTKTHGEVQPVPLIAVEGLPAGAVWGGDHRIVFATTSSPGLLEVDTVTGTQKSLTKLDMTREQSHRWPFFLPDGSLLFTVEQPGLSFDEALIARIGGANQPHQVLFEGGSQARYRSLNGSSGELIFVRGGRLFAITYDSLSHRVDGHARPLGLPGAQGLLYDPWVGFAHLALSSRGTVVYVPSHPVVRESRPVLIELGGGRTALDATPRAYVSSRLSPDGRQLLLRRESDAGLWQLDPAQGTLTRLTYERSSMGVWHPDGLTFTYSTRGATSKLVRQRSAGEPETLVEGPEPKIPNAWTADGRTLVYQQRDPLTGWDLWQLTIADEGPPQAAEWLASPAQEMHAALSPDARHLAYESDELDGVVGIYVRSFSDGRDKRRVSSHGGQFPAFSPTGDEIYFWDASRRSLIGVPFERRPSEPELGHERVVLGPERIGLSAATRGGVLATIDVSGFSITPDGEGIVVLEPEESNEVIDIQRLVFSTVGFVPPNE